eukprot:gnl/Hemi2/28393_TR9389_c0_g1_i1.p1 gnl/Hemi2/28393_TR9389_c0_g1~~gnl/Hemi2/28393_TR9389_c0_g1_i1.p1  ORF type:complete len:317 (-),score=63.40 gnl/Hemi2/28393_TR9389_c0_g1_i1:61-948(-)
MLAKPALVLLLCAVALSACSVSAKLRATSRHRRPAAAGIQTTDRAFVSESEQKQFGNHVTGCPCQQKETCAPTQCQCQVISPCQCQAETPAPHCMNYCNTPQCPCQGESVCHCAMPAAIIYTPNVYGRSDVEIDDLSRSTGHRLHKHPEHHHDSAAVHRKKTHKQRIAAVAPSATTVLSAPSVSSPHLERLHHKLPSAHEGSASESSDSPSSHCCGCGTRCGAGRSCPGPRCRCCYCSCNSRQRAAHLQEVRVRLQQRWQLRPGWGCQAVRKELYSSRKVRVVVGVVLSCVVVLE